MKINQIDKSKTKREEDAFLRYSQPLISKIIKCVDKFLTVIIKVLKYFELLKISFKIYINNEVLQSELFPSRKITKIDL